MAIRLVDCWARGFTIEETAQRTNYTMSEVKRAFKRYDEKKVNKNKRKRKHPDYEPYHSRRLLIRKTM